ncbi:MAG: aldehyde dehydrogenase [Planctomycetes bacterium]|nr:aldehyde dehydrogenase [Planctomycetota bacterium]
MSTIHVPLLRRGLPYRSLDTLPVRHHATGETLAEVSQANAGLLRRDLAAANLAAAAKALRGLGAARRVELCARAGELFRHAALPMGEGAPPQPPEEYVRVLSATSGLPWVLCRRNLEKVHYVLTRMELILRGLTRGLELSVLDQGRGLQGDVPVSFFAAADALGVVLPSNSPGVNSLWLPALALGVPVILKPGGEEPWTPWRIVQAFLAAGCPREALGFYPAGHDGGDVIVAGCGRALLFGDERTVARHAANPAVQVHGPGRSKVLIGPDEIGRWPEHLDVLVASIAENGGRSCVNASAVVVPSHADEIAEALARRLAEIRPRPADDPEALLAAFADRRVADALDASIEEGLREPGAVDVTARLRPAGTARRTDFEGGAYLLPTVVRCGSLAHPLGNREFLFPYASVVEVTAERMVEEIGPSLVVTAITRDREMVGRLLASPHVGRLNLGALPTSHVRWDQPHEGNLFEFLYRRRAIQWAGES